MTLHKRVQALEQRRQVERGVRWFFQDSPADPTVFNGRGGHQYTTDEIDALTARGWKCIIFAWEETQATEFEAKGE